MSYIGQPFELQELYTAVFGYVAKPFPALGDVSDQLTPSNPFGAVDGLVDQYKKNMLGIEMLMPLEIGIPGEELFLLTTEPMISLKLKKRLIRRFPNRSDKNGSIKESWSSDDYQISIKGLVLNYTDDSYPEQEVRKLRKYCEYNNSLSVKNTMLTMFGIDRISIDDFDIPFTSGIKNQAYEIRAYSDKLFDGLLIEA